MRLSNTHYTNAVYVEVDIWVMATMLNQFQTVDAVINATLKKLFQQDWGGNYG